MDRLTTDKRKLFARENPTIMSMNKEELRGHYNQIFDRLQAYENTGLVPEEVEELKKRYFEVVVERDRLKGGKR